MPPIKGSHALPRRVPAPGRRVPSCSLGLSLILFGVRHIEPDPVVGHLLPSSSVVRLLAILHHGTDIPQIPRRAQFTGGGDRCRCLPRRAGSPKAARIAQLRRASRSKGVHLDRSLEAYAAARVAQPGTAKPLQTTQAACCGQNFGGLVAGLRTHSDDRARDRCLSGSPIAAHRQPPVPVAPTEAPHRLSPSPGRVRPAAAACLEWTGGIRSRTG